MGTIKQHLHLSAIMEGISFLVLLGIAMPLKYLAGLPEVVLYTGWAHGILFIWYNVTVLMAKSEYGLSWGQTFLAWAGSVLPFGTFYADRKIFKKL